MQFPTKGHAIKGLDNLTRLLARLKLHGLRSTNVDEVWDDGHVERSSPNTRNSSNPLCALLVSLEESKLCMAALNEVRYHLEKRIRLVQKSCAPSILENGIKILPDEILSLAFEAGHRTTRSCHFANRVSRVSRRFRQISFRTPLLWTRLSVSYTDSQLQAFLSRSGQMDLDVSTMGGWDLSKVKLGLFIQTLQPYSHRWSHLRLQWNAEEIMGEQGITHLPRLKYIFHDYGIDLSSWSLPSLSWIYGYRHHVPLGFAFQPQLTSLEIVFDCQNMDIAFLARVLYASKALQHLSLTLQQVLDIAEGSVLDDTEMPVRHSVPIDTFQITIKELTTYTVVEPLYDALSFFAPSTMHITLDGLMDEDNAANFLYDTGGNFFPYGCTVYIRILAIAPWNRCGILAELMRDCRVARTVHIDAPMAEPISAWSTPIVWKHCSSLRHLQLSYCDRLTENDVSGLVKHLMVGPGETRLESLEILYCRGISEEFLLNISEEHEVEKRLRWKL